MSDTFCRHAGEKLILRVRVQPGARGNGVVDVNCGLKSTVCAQHHQPQ
ncbi:MAG TPA: hypothetical protein VFK12_03685 [Gammaproteobacteria bacterium]|nr:hypothetical protein [Gammaproteobacteria bacterium]